MRNPACSEATTEHRLHWAFSTLGCPDLDLAEAACLAAQYGLDGIEARVVKGRLDLPILFDQTYGTPEAFAAAVRVLPARLIALATGVRLSQFPSNRAELLAFLPWAEAACVPFLRVFDGEAAGLSTAEVVSRIIRALNWWQREKVRNRWQVDLLIEPHWALTEPQSLRRFLDADIQRDRGSLLWDIQHTLFEGGTEPLEFWEEFKPYIRHIHVKDGRVIATRKTYQHSLPGDGDAPVMPLLNTLKAEGYRGFISLEWERHWHPELPSLRDALRAAVSAGWLRDSRKPS